MLGSSSQQPPSYEEVVAQNHISRDPAQPPKDVEQQVHAVMQNLNPSQQQLLLEQAQRLSRQEDYSQAVIVMDSNAGERIGDVYQPLSYYQDRLKKRLIGTLFLVILIIVIVIVIARLF